MLCDFLVHQSATVKSILTKFTIYTRRGFTACLPLGNNLGLSNFKLQVVYSDSLPVLGLGNVTAAAVYRFAFVSALLYRSVLRSFGYSRRLSWALEFVRTATPGDCQSRCVSRMRRSTHVIDRVERYKRGWNCTGRTNSFAPKWLAPPFQKSFVSSVDSELLFHEVRSSCLYQVFSKPTRDATCIKLDCLSII